MSEEEIEAKLAELAEEDRRTNRKLLIGTGICVFVYASMIIACYIVWG